MNSQKYGLRIRFSFALLVLFFLSDCKLQAQSIDQKLTKQQQSVWASTQKLANAMVDADSATLSDLTSDQLSYGHSGGTVENKKEFIDKLLSGRSDFVKITLEDPQIIISGKTAIVRHVLHAETLDNHVSGQVHLKVLLVWQYSKKSWKLLARQAIKISV